MTTLAKEQEINNKVVFIQKASLCDYNHLWICNHKDSRGENCTKICKNYTIKGKRVWNSK